MPDTILQNPCSFIGSTKRFRRTMAHIHPEGWRAVILWPLAILLLILVWACVLGMYLLLTAIPLLWIVWTVHTLNRRHHIHADRRAMMRADINRLHIGENDL
jgi:hypothetical protein